MADLTTVDGYHMVFDPSNVLEVSDHDPVSGEAVTCVYGVTASYVRIAESVAAFLARIGVAAGFAKPTRPSGFPVWLNAKAVGLIRAPAPGEYVGGVQAVIGVGGLTLGVRETVAAATAAINACGGKL